MATVRALKIYQPERSSKQSDADASIILLDFEGEKFVQIDSYGSKDRKLVGKRSQSLRLSKEAFEQLVKLGTAHFAQGQ
ncbi:hypothetical protein EQZ23_04830 [Sphingomonas sp. UV9]|jgi:hypothetical protein|uniref:hypothetical protein n=1 Tax=Sphingomonas sp. UV9 TaxID=1851410 RepID=UPI000FFBFD8F|nr:hypothetical protein [Sphingomonas sp. UV9]RXD07372.1 hypothetical protein EQZ23_04830 [Sphingomonas sp. UV9]